MSVSPVSVAKTAPKEDGQIKPRLTRSAGKQTADPKKPEFSLTWKKQ